MPTAEPDPNLLTLEQVCQLLDAPRNSILALVARDAIPFERPSKGWRRYGVDELRFPCEEVEAWLSRGGQWAC